MSSQPAPDSQKAAVEPPTIDDVVHAIRWILGRDPLSLQSIALRRAQPGGREGLRRSLLLSKEFLSKLADIQVADLCARSGDNIPCLPPDERRIVFIHIPKTGGTTLHTLLSMAVGKDRVCSARYNDLWRCTGAELATARLFSGHYDGQCLSYIPGSNTRTITILREPRERLRSLYRFLRAHKEQRIKAHELGLAAAARQYQFNDFLRAALEINPSTVDNTYVRAFGGRLPMERWERRAEPAAPRRLPDLDVRVDALVRRACDFVVSLSAVGILEDFDQSLKVLFGAIDLPVPEAYQIKHRTADLVERGVLEDSPVTDTEGDGELLERLTRYDQVIYELGRSLLAGRVKKAPA
jgi:hypothetical protein